MYLYIWIAAVFLNMQTSKLQSLILLFLILIAWYFNENPLFYSSFFLGILKTSLCIWKFN